MASEISTIQSLKAVDAWIDVINANINGGVRTAFKSSRLKFSGSNTDVSRAGTSTSLPLQFPEPGLTTANTIIDFSQGAVTASTENSHLAVQGDGFFLVCDPNTIDPTTGLTKSGQTGAQFFVTRDGEFRTNQNGLLVNSSGYYLVSVSTSLNAPTGQQVLEYGTNLANSGAGSSIRAVFNDLDQTVTAAAPQRAVKLTDFLANTITTDIAANAVTANSLLNIDLGKQSLQYTQFGSTIFSLGFKATTSDTAAATANISASFGIRNGTTSDATVLGKSLEASNASMTQSVPELSLAQKLFSALTKVLQTKQTNVDGVLNLVR
jgi:flagellar hook protein FlgE